MPKCIRYPDAPNLQPRWEPYPALLNNDKENINPFDTTTKSKATAKKSTTAPKKRAAAPKPCDDPDLDWRTIEISEIYHEVPCHDSASIVRRKLTNLANSKAKIPCSFEWSSPYKIEKWSKAAIAREMMKLQDLEGPVHNMQYQGSGDPSASALNTFMKKTGEMGGADSPCYYWGYVLLEKLRIYNGEKKTKARLNAEEEYGLSHLLCCLKRTYADGETQISERPYEARSQQALMVFVHGR